MATASGVISVAALYTIYALVLVRDHAARIALEAVLVSSHGMTQLVTPFDPHIADLSHQVSSSLFFGLTLGILCGMVCSLVFVPAWVRGELTLKDAPLVVFASAVCACLGYSGEHAAAGVITGLVCPVVFAAPWCAIIRTARVQTPVSPFAAAVVTALLAAPALVLMCLGLNFLSVRDMLIASPGLGCLSDFYYAHTLLAADVIKPVHARSQNVIAVQEDLGPVGPMPHGTLWVRTPDPCSVVGARLCVATRPLSCEAVRVPGDGDPVNRDSRVFRNASSALDPNRTMRASIGFFLFSGPLVLTFLFILSWASCLIAWLGRRRPAAAVVLVVVCLMLYAPLARHAYLGATLARHPERTGELAASGDETERYMAVSTYPGALDDRRLTALMSDPSPRVRLHAVVEAGSRGGRAFLAGIIRLTRDPQLNVRTKACRALGRMDPSVSVDVLARVARQDPSWYVRDYAYAALGRVRPEAREIVLER